MTRLYINLSYTSPYFHRHKHILIQQRGILWSNHSCWVPYFKWKDLFPILIPVELGYERLKQLQSENTTHFRTIYSIYNRSSVPHVHVKQRMEISKIGVLLVIIIVIISLYHIIQTFYK
jgi:hypothetical protein